MKKIVIFLVGILASVMLWANIQSEKFTGKLVDNAYTYIFEDSKGVKMEFEEYSEDVTVDLDSEEMVGKNFSLEYEIITIELTDDEGEPTGETEKRYVIIKATQVQ